MINLLYYLTESISRPAFLTAVTMDNETEMSLFGEGIICNLSPRDCNTKHKSKIKKNKNNINLGDMYLSIKKKKTQTPEKLVW